MTLTLLLWWTCALLQLIATVATQCDTTTTCTSACSSNSCNTVFGTNLGRRTVGKLCSQSSSTQISCSNPPSNPSLGYANAHAYWCGPGKTQADCGNVNLEGTVNTQFCQGSACLLVDGEYVWNCFEGHFLDRNKCSLCMTGQFRSDLAIVTGRSCKICSQGAYQNEVGGIICKACPAGYRVGECGTNDVTAYQGWVAGEAAHSGCTACQECSSGQFQTSVGENVCTRCPSGKYGKPPGSGVARNSEANGCVTCPNGRWTGQNSGNNGATYNPSMAGSLQCTACPPGKYGTNGQCQDCTASLGVTTTPGNAACVKCNLVASGTIWASATSCTPCASGSQPKSPNYSECEDCAVGLFSPDGTPCARCGAGTGPNLASKAVRCDNCLAGKYQSSSMNACEPCLAGKAPLSDQSDCDNCASGRVAPNPGTPSCTPCAAGTSATNKAQACSTCLAGQFSGNFADACTPCSPGRAQSASGQSACEACSGLRSYTKGTYDATNQPYTECKDCCGTAGAANCGQVATADHDDCAACPAGQYSFNSVCTACLPCSEGAQRNGCGDATAGACDVCAIGKYKIKGVTGGAYTDQCQDCTPCPLGKQRHPADDPCVRDGGGSTTDTSTCNGCGSGFFQSTAISERTLFYPENAVLDRCDACADCLPGGERTSCGGSSAGQCAPWGTPTVTAVTGSGKDSGATTGNQPLIIEGQHFGGNLAGGRDDIIVRYGPQNNIGKYVLDNSDPSNNFVKPCEITEYDETTKIGTLQCTTTEGVGKGYWIQVQVGINYGPGDQCQPTNGCSIKMSPLFDAQINYARPIVASYTVGADPANNMATSGSEDLVVVGSNFGPAGTTVDTAVYGDDGNGGGGGTQQQQYVATGCTVISHTQMNCKTARGAGANHKLVVTIAGQQSTVPAVGYGIPTLSTRPCDNTSPYDSFQCRCDVGTGTFGSVCSGYQDSGTSKWFTPAITIGATVCKVNNYGGVNCTLPTATLADATNGHSLSTRGGQRVVLSGINVGGSRTNSNGDVVMELEEVRIGPTSTTSRVIPLVHPVPADWLTSNDVPGCVLNIPHFSILCNTPPGIGRDHYFFLTVAGQQMQLDNGGNDVLQGYTSYNLPNVQTLTAQSGSIGTEGGDVIVLKGDDFGTRASGVAIEAWLFREGENVASFKSGAGSGLIVLDNMNQAQDFVSLPVPAGFGR